MFDIYVRNFTISEMGEVLDSDYQISIILHLRQNALENSRLYFCIT